MQLKQPFQRSARVHHHQANAPCRKGRSAPLRRVQVDATNNKESEPSTSSPSTGVGLKAVWYGAELFGKLVGRGNSAAGATAAEAGPAKPKAMTREAVIQAIREDYANSYFVSGVGDMAAYDPNCEFADPFVAFKGVGRFKQNVGNLGRLMKDIQLDVYDWQEGEQSVETKWRFSCILDLPWRPRLAAAGGTTHVLDPQTGAVVRHIESWDVEPAKVVKQLFKPASRIPSNAAETFFLALSEGDAPGMWLALSPVLLKLSLPIIGVSLACKAVTGEGLPGTFLGATEGLSYLAFLAAGVTEAVKLLRQTVGS